MSVFVRTLIALVAAAAAAALPAQSLPVSVSVSGQTAVVRVGSPVAPLADVRLDFDDVTGLSPTSLGVSAEWIDVSSPALLARLPGGGMLSVPSELPLLVTVEPPAFGGLSLRRVVHVELHTHALVYTAGSRYRLLKAPLGGPFHDITGSVQPGSVRTRGSTPGFSQFIVALDLRPTTQVIAEKIARLRSSIDRLPTAEAAPFDALVDTLEAAVLEERFADAISALEALRQRAAERSGITLPQEWRATRDRENIAGALLAGADTLAFSIGQLRDHGD